MTSRGESRKTESRQLVLWSSFEMLVSTMVFCKKEINFNSNYSSRRAPPKIRKYYKQYFK